MGENYEKTAFAFLILAIVSSSELWSYVTGTD
jgi:hypothetical protein